VGVNYQRVPTVAAIMGSLVLGVTGCGNAPTSADTVWVINVTSPVVSGGEIFLDGESVYRQAGATVLRHRAEVNRPVRAGSHVIEFVVLAEESEPTAFQMSVTSQRRHGGDYQFLNAEPTPLRVGERTSVTVEQ
jgi:hypothetical protein